jgi:hypothetical protein
MAKFTALLEHKAGVKDEKEVKVFLRSPNRKFWFTQLCKDHAVGEAVKVNRHEDETAYMATQAGLLSSEGSEYKISEKGWALAKELGFDKDSDQAAKDQAKAQKDSVKVEYDSAPGLEFQITIPVIIKDIRVHKLIDSTGKVGLDIECNFDRDAMDAAAKTAMMEHAGELGFGDLLAGGSGIYVTLPKTFINEAYHELHNIKYR